MSTLIMSGRSGRPKGPLPRLTTTWSEPCRASKALWQRRMLWDTSTGENAFTRNWYTPGHFFKIPCTLAVRPLPALSEAGMAWTQ